MLRQPEDSDEIELQEDYNNNHVQPVSSHFIDKCIKAGCEKREKSNRTRQTKPSFTFEENEALVTCVNKNSSILYGAFSQNITQLKKQMAWNKVLNAVKAVGNYERSLADIKKRLKNMKTIAKRKECHNKNEIRKTGGGVARFEKLNPFEEIIIENMSNTEISGIAGGIDVHEPSSSENEDPSIENAYPNFMSRPQGNLNVTVKENVQERSLNDHSDLLHINNNIGESLPAVKSNKIDCTTQTLYRSHSKVQKSILEELQEEQVSILKEQMNTFKRMESLMKERNDIEREKLLLKKMKMDIVECEQHDKEEL